MNVNIIIPTLHRGGAERVVSLLSQEWAIRRSVTVTCFDATNSTYIVGGRLIDLRLRARLGVFGKAVTMIRRVVALRRSFICERPDRIIGFMESANFPTIIAAALACMLDRVTVSVHLYPGFLSPMRRLAVRVLYRFPVDVVAVSEEGRDYLVDRLGVPRARCRAISNPIDFTMLRAKADETIARPPSSRPFILAVGRLDRVKGFDLLIDAFATLALRHEVDLVILGEGAERDYLQARIVAQGMSQRIFLHGAVDNPWAWMARCALFVLSSRFEGWPNALAEAMACGAVAIACDCPSGPSEMLTGGLRQFLVPVEDVAALAAAIDRVLGDAAARARFQQEAALVVSRWDLASVAARW